MIWACAAPVLALYIRDAYVLSYEGARTAALYCGISLAFSLLSFLVFRLHHRVMGHFSVHDALNVVKAVLAAQLMTSLLLFTVTRLEGIPRTTPIIHALILMIGLIVARSLASMYGRSHKASSGRPTPTLQHIIMVGSTRLTSLYIELLQACSPGDHRVIAVLDEEKSLIGRVLAGVPIVAPPQDLEPVIEEFAVHGIRTDRVIVGGDQDVLPEEQMEELRLVCRRREIDLEFVPQLIGIRPLEAPQTQPTLAPEDDTVPDIELPRYFRLKRFLDFVGALVLIIVLLPLFLLTAGLVLLDVGTPVLFWQQRIGQRGQPFLLHKLRTLRPPFDGSGQPVPEDQRMSRIGRLLRETRLDELPQLLNVLVGDMSIIGPRPLLPRDQPSNPTVRLMVRPGITGWAQVHGGNLATPTEKDERDEWYIRNASFWLDLKIIGRTILFLCTGERRSEEALANTRAERGRQQIHYGIAPRTKPDQTAQPLPLPSLRRERAS